MASSSANNVVAFIAARFLIVRFFGQALHVNSYCAEAYQEFEANQAAAVTEWRNVAPDRRPQNSMSAAATAAIPPHCTRPLLLQERGAREKAVNLFSVAKGDVRMRQGSVDVVRRPLLPHLHTRSLP